MPGIKFLMLNQIKTIRAIKFHIVYDNMKDPLPFSSIFAKCKYFNDENALITECKNRLS